MEKFFEKMLYSTRWLLAPIYLGLSLVLVALLIEFFESAVYLLLNVSALSESDVILKVLTLIDIALVGGLIVMVMFAGYENFVSQLDLKESTDKLVWLGKLDTSSLKNKVAASIVAISSIHLLKVFMNAPEIANDKILWYVVLHMTFVVSAFAMGLLDRIMTRH